MNQSKSVSVRAIQEIIHTFHSDPFQVLGAHLIEDDGQPVVAVRAFKPDASAMFVVDVKTGEQFPMLKLHDGGFVEAILTGRKEVFPYRLAARLPNGAVEEYYDSYAFLPTLGEMDTYLFNQGNHHLIYEQLGAHLRVVDYHGTKIGGIGFAVWAPNAERVSVVGDFNGWNSRAHAMRLLGGSGIWEIFIPGLPMRQIYKYEVKMRGGATVTKADPFAFAGEVRPNNASVTADLSGYTWNDSEWMSARAKKEWLKEPIAIYECHLGSWMRDVYEGNRFLTYRELAEKLAAYLKDTGYTHVELLPITEHPLDISWGYQVTGFFAPTSRFGAPNDFRYFVDYMHQHGIGVLLDWVPAHFPKDSHGLARFDGTALYEHFDPRQGEHKDWSTYIFNYGRNEVKNFLISCALFWADQYHIDGYRVDAVASMLYLDYSRQAGEWVPNKHGGRENLEAIEFIKYFNSVTGEKFPGILTIAEESTAWPGVSTPLDKGGLGFSFKWNMGWMHDTLKFFQADPIYRKYHQEQLTFPLMYAFSEKFVSVLSHDEVVHGKGSLVNKMPGDYWQKFANLRLLLSFMWTMPGKKLLMMGQEFGQWNEWNCNVSLDWHLLGFEAHRGVLDLISRLNALYRTERPLHLDSDHTSFAWIDFSDHANSVASWMRRGEKPDEDIVVVANFTPVVRRNYRVGLPSAGYWREILNTDSKDYFGSNVGNEGGRAADAIPWQGQKFSAAMNLPPLGLVAFKRDALS
jgi:1,4-alpha-glucan branching enzyme